MSRLGALGGVLAGVVLLAAAAAVTSTAPDDDALQAPIPVRGAVGRLVVARTTEAEVHGAVAARRVDLGDGGPGTATDGVWLAIDVTVGCRLSSCSFEGSQLRAGGRTYLPAVLAPLPSFTELGAQPGLLYRTTALFELPRSALAARSADLVLQQGETDALDSVPVIRLALPSRAVERVAVHRAAVTGVQR